eukprot:PITA_04089
MLLKSSAKDCIIPRILDWKIAPEIWKTLKDLYEVKNTNLLLFLKREIISIKMEKNETGVAFISRIKELKNKLGDMSEVVSNIDLVTITMNGNVDNLIKEIKEQMSQVFEMKDLGELHYCLGLEVWRDFGQTFLSQCKYVRSLLEKFIMDQCKAATVPLQHNIKLQNDDGSKEAVATLYRQLVGSLIYLNTTRPYLAYAVSALSQFMSKPLESHRVAAKSVLRYLQGTLDFGIVYTDSCDVKLTGFSDSNWVGIVNDRQSIIGYPVSIGSGVITWSSKEQNTLSLSSVEAEYQAMCAATCEAVWLRRLLLDAGEEQKVATMIKCDNQSSIKLVNNPLFHKNTKHIDTQFHFVREKIQSKEIHIEYCNSCDNVADIFTKPLSRIKFELFREVLGICVNPFLH